MKVFDCRQEKNITQIFETHLHFAAGIHREVASGHVLWKAVAASGQVLWCGFYAFHCKFAGERCGAD